MTVTVSLDHSIRTTIAFPFSRGMLACPTKKEDFQVLVDREDITTIKRYRDKICDPELFLMIKLSLFRLRYPFIVELTRLFHHEGLGKYLGACMGDGDLNEAIIACTTYRQIDLDTGIETYQQGVPPGYLILGKVLSLLFTDDNIFDIDAATLYRVTDRNFYFGLACSLSHRFPEQNRYYDLAMLFTRYWHLGTVLTTLANIATEHRADRILATIKERQLAGEVMAKKKRAEAELQRQRNMERQRQEEERQRQEQGELMTYYQAHPELPNHQLDTGRHPMTDETPGNLVKQGKAPPGVTTGRNAISVLLRSLGVDRRYGPDPRSREGSTF